MSDIAFHPTGRGEALNFVRRVCIVGRRLGTSAGQGTDDFTGDVRPSQGGS